MPLVRYSLDVVKHVVDLLAADPDRAGRVFCLSHPDVVCPPADVEALFGLPAASLPVRPDSADVVRWHKAGGITDRVVHTGGLFAALGYEMTCVDVAQGRGGELFHDLSMPIPEEHRGRYDLVFDCISNQVFNVGEAVATAAAAARVGGYVMHVTPVTMVNQGFYCVSPTAYHDFYAANGFTMVVRRAVRGVYTHKGEVALDEVRRCRDVPEDVMNLVLARKDRDVRPTVWPIMAKFVTHPGARLTT